MVYRVDSWRNPKNAAGFAIACAEIMLPFWEADWPDSRPRRAIEIARMSKRDYVLAEAASAVNGAITFAMQTELPACYHSILAARSIRDAVYAVADVASGSREYAHTLTQAVMSAVEAADDVARARILETYVKWTAKDLRSDAIDVIRAALHAGVDPAKVVES